MSINVGRPMCCSCSLFKDFFEFGQGLNIELKIYEKVPDKICGPESDNTYFYKNEPIPAFISRPAPPGLYKIKLGISEQLFEIR